MIKKAHSLPVVGVFQMTVWNVSSVIHWRSSILVTNWFQRQIFQMKKQTRFTCLSISRLVSTSDLSLRFFFLYFFFFTLFKSSLLLNDASVVTMNNQINWVLISKQSEDCNDDDDYDDKEWIKRNRNRRKKKSNYFEFDFEIQITCCQFLFFFIKIY